MTETLQEVLREYLLVMNSHVRPMKPLVRVYCRQPDRSSPWAPACPLRVCSQLTPSPRGATPQLAALL